MRKLLLVLPFVAFMSAGCSFGNEAASDPTERGLSYVAGAIVTAAVIRALFNQ